MSADPASLDNLRDIVAPPPAPLWPPAPGWYWLLGALAVAALVAGARALLYWQRNRYRREALAELAAYEAAALDPSRRTAALSRVAELLKRAALTAYPRSQVASLTGLDWYGFLDRSAPGCAFAGGVGHTLERAAFDPASLRVADAEAARAILLARRWLATHRRPSPSAASDQ